jgi:hypothetical protein
MCEANYSRISRVLREMYEEIYYSWKLPKYAWPTIKIKLILII